MTVVYDPDGGFVTGGGWINSPVGAYKADESLSGKANFGFVSKYHLAIGTWKKIELPPGQALRQPAPLFKRLDEGVIEEEYARL